VWINPWLGIPDVIGVLAVRIQNQKISKTQVANWLLAICLVQ